MKQNELTIEIPDNKVVDWDESKKQNKIVLKDKQLTYDDVAMKFFHNKKFYTTSERGDIKPVVTGVMSECLDANNATTQHQLECVLAKNKLANVAVYLNDGWKPESNDIVAGLILEGTNDTILFPTYRWNTPEYVRPQFAFKSKDLAHQAIEILGEETVKLALEPLY